MRFDNHRVVITAAGRDFGRTLALQLADLGAKVFLSARSIAAAGRTSSRCKPASLVEARRATSLAECAAAMIRWPAALVPQPQLQPGPADGLARICTAGVAPAASGILPAVQASCAPAVHTIPADADVLVPAA
jgi:NAD(P)-dependent dehydrogenase (short-subunit alcohol dehydrogenase family)